MTVSRVNPVSIRPRRTSMRTSKDDDDNRVPCSIDRAVDVGVEVGVVGEGGGRKLIPSSSIPAEEDME